MEDADVIIRTHYGTYHLYQQGRETVLKKIEDNYPGGHPKVPLGKERCGVRPNRPIVGKSFYVSPTEWTSAVVSIEPQKGDERLVFSDSDG